MLAQPFQLLQFENPHRRCAGAWCLDQPNLPCEVAKAVSQTYNMSSVLRRAAQQLLGSYSLAARAAAPCVFGTLHPQLRSFVAQAQPVEDEGDGEKHACTVAVLIFFVWDAVYQLSSCLRLAQL